MELIQSAVAWFTEVWRDWSTLIRIILILVFAIIARSVLLVSVKRVVGQIVSGAKSKAENSGAIARARVVQRAKTMGSVLANIITWTIFTLAVTMILSELGVAVGALIAGAGIIGAAIGFGAQNLVRDFLSGLFIVLEDQYGVGDTVDLGEASGVVENVGLRVTKLRDSKGTVWFVRNGEILRVGNLSAKSTGLKKKSRGK
jgi:small conductance mechanosensitive channel